MPERIPAPPRGAAPPRGPTATRGPGGPPPARTYRSWDDAELILDIAPGDPEGFSLGPGRSEQFVLSWA